jgi:hypothetical protein
MGRIDGRWPFAQRAPQFVGRARHCHGGRQREQTEADASGYHHHYSLQCSRPDIGLGSLHPCRSHIQGHRLICRFCSWKSSSHQSPDSQNAWSRHSELRFSVHTTLRQARNEVLHAALAAERVKTARFSIAVLGPFGPICLIAISATGQPPLIRERHRAR